MLRIGGTASPGHITVFRGLKTHFQQQGIALDWVLYADYDALVEAFATREIDLAWNGPLSYVHIKQRLNDPCRVVAMRDVDINFRTQLFTRRDSSITTLADLLGKEVLDAEGCQAFVPGITTGWEALESALSEPIR